MRGRVWGVVVLLALAAGVWAAPAGAQLGTEYLPLCDEEGFDWGLGPTLVPADDFGDRFGARVGAVGCRSGHDMAGNFPASYALQLDAEYLWVQDGVQLPQATRIRGAAGLSLSFSRPPKRAPRDLHPDSLATWDGGGFNLGFFDLGVTAGYEASADGSEKHLAAGVEGRWAINTGGWARILPSLVARYEWVEPTASAVRDAAMIPDDDDAHARFSALAWWNTSLDFLADPLERLRLQAELALFRTEGLESVLETAGWDEGEYGKVSLQYDAEWRVGGPLSLDAVYLSWADGQLPTDGTDRDAWSGGLIFKLGN